jgi:hypothetical protein
MPITMKQLFKLAPLLIGVIVVVGVLVFYNFNQASVYNELYALDLIPKPEKLTELYFNNSANLPSTVTSKQVVSFAFVIHNLETTDFQYTYVVSVVDANGVRRVVDSGNVLVRNNQYYAKRERFSLIKSSGSQMVLVELTNKLQSIDFWLNKNS